MRKEDVIEIDRQPEDVFALLTDPDRLAACQSTTVGVRRKREGPLVVGERFDEIHKALGRTLYSTVEVTAYEAPRLFALDIVEGAMPLNGRWELTPNNGGTRLHFVGEGDVQGAKRLAKPMLALQFRRFHQRLRELLEDK